MTDAMWLASACVSGLVTTTRWIANAGRAAVHRTATVASAAHATSATAAAMRLSSLASCQTLCHTAGPLFRFACRKPQDREAQIGEWQAGFLRGHRHEAVSRHARRCVELEEREGAVAAQHDVRAPPAAAPQHAERAQRLGLDARLDVRVDAGRAVVLGVVGEVLVL